MPRSLVPATVSVRLLSNRYVVAGARASMPGPPARSPGLAISGSGLSVIVTQTIQRQGNCVEFGVGSRAEKFSGIVLEEGFAGVEGNNLDAAHGRGKARSGEMFGQPLLQLLDRGRRFGRLRPRAERRNE